MWWKRKQRDFQEEIEAHVQLEADELFSDGLPPTEATAAAKRAFGNQTATLERFYEASRWIFLSHLLRDLRFAARMLRKDFCFSGLAVLGLALGIGVSTAIFALILTVMQFEDRASAVNPGTYVSLLSRGRDTDLSYSTFRYYQQHSASFESMNAESGRGEFILNPISNGGEAENVEGRFESANFLTVSGLRPALGRNFSQAEEQAGSPVTLLAFSFWQRRFSGDAGVVGKTIVLNHHAVAVIGVADARFAPADGAAFYFPLELQPLLSDRGDWLHAGDATWLHVNARLRPSVQRPQAQAELDVLSGALGSVKSANSTTTGIRVLAGGGNPQKRREFIGAAFAAILAVSMILLIACSNLANLLLARAAVRHREIGVRLSLGASRGRLLCQLLTESMLLAMAGGALGLVFSFWLAKTLFVLVNQVPGLELPKDPRVFLYGVLLSLATGVSFGLAPALAATKTNLARALHSEGLSGVSHCSSRRIWSPRNLLVIVPLAVSLMLLMGAALTLRLIQRMYFGGPAFDTTHLIEIGLRLRAQGYDEARTLEFQENLRARIANMPGVRAVALATSTPISNGTGWFPLVAGDGSLTSTDGRPPAADYNVVSAGFFETAGAPVVRGRTFSSFEREGDQPVAMVNQELARRYWPSDEPIGKHIRFATGTAFFEVVGVAPDFEDPDESFNSVRPTVYVPYGQGKLLLAGDRTGAPPYQTQFLVRTTSEPSALKSVLRQAALATDPSLWISIQTFDEKLESKTGPLKLISSLLSGLGVLALLMAAVGIYAILAYSVSQRTREFGIRMALGARRGEILALVMQRTVTLIACGVGVGLLGALALSRILASSLSKLGGLDAITCLLAALILGAVAMFASYLPARKALRVDPVQALRCE